MSAYYGMSVSHIVDRVDSPLCRIWLDKLEKAKEKRRRIIEQLDALNALVNDTYDDDSDDDDDDVYRPDDTEYRPTRIAVSTPFTAHYSQLMTELADVNRAIADLKDAEECCCEYHRQR